MTLSTPAHWDNDEHQIIFDGSAFIAVWERRDNGATVVQSSRSTDGGLTWSPAVTVGGNFADRPSIAASAAGIVVGWRDQEGGEEKLRAARSTDGGASWHPYVEFYTGVNTYPTALHLTSNGTRVTAIWRHNVTLSRIYSASTTDGGVTWSTPVAISEDGKQSEDPHAISDGTRITAIWHLGSTGNEVVQTAFSIDGGASWSTPQNLSSTDRRADLPRVIFDGDVIIAAWAHEDADGDFRIQIASSADGGVTWAPTITLSPPDDSGIEPQLVRNGSATSIIWEQRIGSYGRVQVSTSTDDGATWSAPLTLSDDGGTGDTPAIISYGGTLTAAWQRHDGQAWRVQTSSLSPAAAPEPELALGGMPPPAAPAGLALALLALGGLALARRSRNQQS